MMHQGGNRADIDDDRRATGRPTPVVEFRRLTEIPLSTVKTLLNEPRNARHMPLAAPFDDARTAEWVESKDAQWAADGYGPWAVVVDGQFVGWGGFQRENVGPEFALVLSPSYWGVGADVTRADLEHGFREFRFQEVFVALPYSRSPDGLMNRLGFTSVEESESGGVRFRCYRLTLDTWVGLHGGVNPPGVKEECQAARDNRARQADKADGVPAA